MKIQIKKMRQDAILPTLGSSGAAGYDLYSQDDHIIRAGCTVSAGTGVAIAIPDGYVGLIFARSGLATKRGLAPANKVGVIDSDYRGELIVALHNHAHSSTQRVEKGDRIAQLVIVPCILGEFEEVEELDSTERGAGGFGSSGK